MDPMRRGESIGWHAPDEGWTGAAAHRMTNWDRVTLPHDYLSDPRYEYTGAAWYRRSFTLPEGAAQAEAWALQFDTVFQRCRVFLNGTLIGEHEGGYAPFEIDATAALRHEGFNFLSIEVDNSIIPRGLPGGRSGNLPRHQLYPWLNYGGLLGEVRLVGRPATWVANQRIEAKPGPNGSGSLSISVFLRNAAKQPASVAVEATIRRADGTALPARLATTVQMQPSTETIAVVSAELPAGSVELWDLDSPNLYVSEVTARVGGKSHSHTSSFGFRTIEAAGGELRLNGSPIRLGGGNRTRGHPQFGGIDTDETVHEDMTLLKAAGLEFARLQHTAPGRNVLEWADRNGMLLVLEVGVWGTPAADIGSEIKMVRFRQEMREMMELSWNHPSVIGWSVGNEYDSWTPEGIEWTRETTRFVKELDPTRLTTFAALGNALRRLKVDPVAEHAFDYIDLISCNIYFPLHDMAPHLDPVHVRWPEKPVAITEFGRRADQVQSEQERIDHFDQVLAMVRERPWICGIAYWSFNDYKSRYPASAADGMRPWGLVDFHRNPRDLYWHVAKTLAPVALSASIVGNRIEVTVESDPAFPSRALRAHRLVGLDGQGKVLSEAPVADLAVGARVSVSLPSHPELRDVQLLSPSGMEVVRTSLQP